MSDDEATNFGRYSGFIAAASSLEAESHEGAGKKRKRPAEGGAGGSGRRVRHKDDDEEEPDYERAPRAVQSDWHEKATGRLPVKLADGSVQLLGARPAQPDKGAKREKGVRPSEREAVDESGSDKDEDDDDDAYGNIGSDNDDEQGGDGDEGAGDGEGEGAADGGAGKGARPPKPKRVDPRDRVPDDGFGRITTYAQWLHLDPASRAARRTGRKLLIADCAERIIGDPTNNMSEPTISEERAAAQALRAGGKKAVSRKRDTLGVLHALCLDADPVVRQLAVVSAVAVFVDICPTYRIRPPTEKEAGVKVKKEVRKLREQEAQLLRCYQRFLRLLEFFVLEGERKQRGGKGQGGEHAGATPHSAGGGFEADLKDEGGSDDEDDGAEGGAGKGAKGKKVHISDRDFNAGKMAEKRADAALKAGLIPYDAPAEVQKALALSAVQALCRALSSLWHFNFANNILSFLVPRASSRDEELANPVCAALETLFVSDTSFETSLEAVKILSNLVRDSATHRGGGAAHRIKSTALKPLLKLPLNILERIDSDREKKGGRGGPRPPAAKKKGKGLDEDAAMALDIAAGLKAADAEALEDRKRIAKAVLRHTITIYFRVLRTPSHTHLLPEVLQGLARFAHLIDVSVVQDLLAALKSLVSGSAGLGLWIEDGSDAGKKAGGSGGTSTAAVAEEDGGKPSGPRAHLSLSSALNCVLTALRVMSGPGEVLTVDETEFAHFLYASLLRLLQPEQQEHVLLAVQCVQALLLSRREYSQERVAAFAKRLLLLCVSVPPHAAAPLLSLTRALCHRYPSVASIMSLSTGRGGSGSSGSSGSSAASAASLSASSSVSKDAAMAVAAGSRGAVVDPDHGASLSATAWELALLHTSYQPRIRELAQRTAVLAPLTPAEAPFELHRTFNGELSGLFDPAIPEPRPHPLASRMAKDDKERQDLVAAAASSGDRKAKRKAKWLSKQRYYFPSELLPPSASAWVAASVAADEAQASASASASGSAEAAVPADEAAWEQLFEAKQMQGLSTAEMLVTALSEEQQQWRLRQG